MSADFYVYALWIAGKPAPFYVGKGRGNRCYVHFRESSLRGKSRKNNIIKKMMRDSREIYIQVLEDALDEETAFASEKKWISYYGRSDTHEGVLANRTDGGEGPSGRIISAEQRAIISKTWTGRSHSAASRKLMSESRKGYKHTDAAKLKMSKSHSGKVLTAEHRRRISASCKGKGFAGKTHSEAALQMNRDAHRMDSDIYESRLAWANPLFRLVTHHIRPKHSRVQCRYCGIVFDYLSSRLLRGSVPTEHFECAKEAYELDRGTQVYALRGCGGQKKPPIISVDAPKGMRFKYELRPQGVIFFNDEGLELYRVRLPRAYVQARLNAESLLTY